MTTAVQPDQVGVLRARARQSRQLVDRQLGEAQQLARHGIELTGEVATLTTALATHEQACAVLTSIGETRQESAQRQIEELVTRALQVIFSDNLSFHLTQEVKGNQSFVGFTLRTTLADGTEVDTDMDARGGGMAAVVGFVLRLVILLLTPGARRFLALDETFAHVSKSYETALAEFLREVVDKAGVQLLLVTHSDAFDLADRKYRLVLDQATGITEVQEGASE